MIFAWQGWRLAVPDDWYPAKLHGSFEAGCALLADLRRPRLGLRWSSPGKRFDVRAWSRRAIVEEVGRLAAEEAREFAKGSIEGLSYVDEELPGRRVWAGRSSASGRVVEIVHHANDTAALISPSPGTPGEGWGGGSGCAEGTIFISCVHDSPINSQLAWSVFDLSCRTHAGWRLESNRLNAGDLTLQFARKSQRMSIRQIAVARLALKRMSIQQWAEDQIRPRLKRYHNASFEPVTIDADGERMLEGVSCRLERKVGMWLAGVPAGLIQLALHDASRDRLVFIEGQDWEAVQRLAQSLGWAHQQAVC